MSKYTFYQNYENELTAQVCGKGREHYCIALIFSIKWWRPQWNLPFIY